MDGSAFRSVLDSLVEDVQELISPALLLANLAGFGMNFTDDQTPPSADVQF